MIHFFSLKLVLIISNCRGGRPDTVCRSSVSFRFPVLFCNHQFPYIFLYASHHIIVFSENRNCVGSTSHFSWTLQAICWQYYLPFLMMNFNVWYFGFTVELNIFISFFSLLCFISFARMIQAFFLLPQSWYWTYVLI